MEASDRLAWEGERDKRKEAKNYKKNIDWQMTDELPSYLQNISMTTNLWKTESTVNLCYTHVSGWILYFNLLECWWLLKYSNQINVKKYQFLQSTSVSNQCCIKLF